MLKMREIVSIADFGTNLTQTLAQAAINRAAIQAAIDSGADHVWFPGGDVWIDDQLLLLNKDTVTLQGVGGPSTLFKVGTADATKAHIKIQSSSYCKVRNLALTNQNDAAASGFGVYITSEGNNPITQFNEIVDCRVSNCLVAGIQIGHATVNADVNVDRNTVRNCAVSFCGRVATPGGGIRIHCTNTNMTVVEGTAVASCIPDNIVIALGARGVTLDNIFWTPDSGTNSVHLHVKNGISGPITIKNIVCELYDEQFLVVDPVSGGVSTYPLLTVDNVNLTNNATVAGIKIIDYQGTGNVKISNFRCAGGASTSGGAGGTLSFQPSNVAQSGGQYLVTDNIHLYDGCTWDVKTKYNESSYFKWIDLGTMIGGSSGGSATTNSPKMRVLGGVNIERDTLTPLTLAAGGTINSLGHMARAVYKCTISYTAFTANAVKHEFVLATLPAKTAILGCYCDTTVAFAGLAGTITIEVGTAGSLADLIALHDVKTATVTKGLADADLGAGLARATAVQGGTIKSWTGASQPHLTLRSGTGNVGNGTVTNLTAGSVTVYLITETMP
jgi:hypothetical protein